MLAMFWRGVCPDGAKQTERNMKKNKNYTSARNKKSEHQLNDSRPNLIQLLPVIFFTSVIIFITRLKIYSNPLKELFWWNQQGEQLADFFSYYKMYAILICSFFAVCLLVYLAIKKELNVKKSPVYLPMIIFMVCVMLSYLLSDYREFSLLGWEDRFEGTLVLLAYMIMLFYTINMVRGEKAVRWVVYSVLVSCAILGLIGLSQGLGHDIFAAEWGKKLIIPQEYWQYLDQLKFKFKNKEIYQTVYNINYVSFNLSLIIPLVGTLYLTCNKQNKKMKILTLLLFALLVYNLFGASSSGGIFGITVSVILSFFLFGKRFWKWKWEAMALVTIVVVISIVNSGTLAPELSSSIQSVIKGKAAPQVHELIKNSQPASADTARPTLELIKTNPDSIEMSFNGQVIQFVIARQDDTGNIKDIELLDQDGTPLDLNAQELTNGAQYRYGVADPRFQFCTADIIRDNGSDYIQVNIPEMTWTFLIDKNEIRYRTRYGSLVHLDQVDTFGFKGREGFGSGRGYIWSRSLPLLKDTLLWGHGADTFAAYFPQYDFAGKYTGPSFSRNIDAVIRKPHSFYIGTAVNTGLISLLALAGIFGIYIVQSFVLYRKNDFNDYLSKAGAGIFLGVSSFLAAALLYDSNVCVSPMFYGLLGTGIAINHIVKRSEDDE